MSVFDSYYNYLINKLTESILATNFLERDLHKIPKEINSIMELNIDIFLPVLQSAPVFPKGHLHTGFVPLSMTQKDSPSQEATFEIQSGGSEIIDKRNIQRLEVFL